MDTPSLRGISRTAPYFVNNSVATLEDMLEHYKQFFKRVQTQNAAAPLLTTQPGVTPPVIDRPFTDAEVPALLDRRRGSGAAGLPAQALIDRARGIMTPSGSAGTGAGRPICIATGAVGPSG